MRPALVLLIVQFFLFLSTVLVVVVEGWSTLKTPPSTTRRELWHTATAAAALFTTPPPANAAPPKPPPKYLQERGSVDKPLSPCYGQPVKKNCWSTQDTASRRMEPWVPPTALAKRGPQAVLQEIQDILTKSYPQTGQGSIDAGGWRLAEQQSSDNIYYARYEFVSKKFKYVDDLEVRVTADGAVQIRSASREGGFDYGVNASRLNFLATALQTKGWQVKMI